MGVSDSHGIAGVDPSRASFGVRHGRSWLGVPAVFCTHQSLAALGPMLAVPWVLLLLGEIGLHLGVKTYISQTQWLLYGTPYFPAHVAIALFLGWVLGGTLRARSMLWVWVLPLLTLFSAIASFPRSLARPSVSLLQFIVLYPFEHVMPLMNPNTDFAFRLRYYFGWGHGFQPVDQVLATVPFYSAAAYSLGALLARKVARLPGFFERMRHLRTERLIPLVGIPWFLLKTTLLWQQTAAHLPIFRTWLGLRFFLEGMLVTTAFVVLVFAAAVAAGGRRFYITRFFLRPSTQDSLPKPPGARPASGSKSE